MTDNWQQLSLSAPLEEVGALISLLEDNGAQAITQQNAREDSYYDLASPGEPQWQHQKITALFELNDMTDGLLIELQTEPNLVRDLSIEQLIDQDWQTQWQDQYQAMEVASDLWICPSWIDQVFPRQATVIKIDPGLAFGTGTHETTQLCMQALNDLDLDDANVLDYGCGSGVLGIAAIKLGAKQAIGVDIDPKAEVVAVQNSSANRVRGQFIIESAAQAVKRNYQVVVANILASALIELSASLTAALEQRGTLILSGILEHQAQSVIDHYAQDFEFASLQRNEWVALVGKKI